MMILQGPDTYALMGIEKIPELIIDLRSERGWTQSDLAQRLNVPQSSVSLRESGRFKGWTSGERRRIASVFELSLDQFDSMWRSSTISQTKGSSGIPVINRAPAGEVIDYEEHGIDSGQGYEYIDRSGLEGDLLFAVVVTGESMEPTIHSGDYLVFNPLDRERPSGHWRDGAVCFVRFSHAVEDGGCTIARVHLIGSQLLLTKDNPDYGSRIVDRSDVVQMGIAVERRTKKGM